MAWHRKNSKNASFTNKDASLSRPVCRACAQGTMRQTSTNTHRSHRIMSSEFGQQFSLDAYQHGSYSLTGNKYCDLFTDLASRQVYPIFSKTRLAEDLCLRIDEFFDRHPQWKVPGSNARRFVRTDPEPSYMSRAFLACMSAHRYEVERTPPRDKHANGIAERTIGLITAKANVALLAPTPRVPQRYWDLAIQYACTTQSFNFHSAIDDSPYHLITGNHVDIKNLHPFWAKCYVYIPIEQRSGKLGFPRTYDGRLVGYAFTSTEFRTYYVVEDKGHGVYGKVRCTKDVTFDDSAEYVYWSEEDSPADNEYENVNEPVIPPGDDIPEVQAPAAQEPHLPFPPRAHIDLEIEDPPQLPVYVEPPQEAPPDPDLPPPAVQDADIEDIAVYWYQFRVDYRVGSTLASCFKMKATVERDLRVPKCHKDAMRDPTWADAIDKELSKFEVNHCLHVVPYTGQHKVPMMWLFSIKTDGTYKARLVVRGDQMIPYVDFDPNAVYCGNVSACSIKIVLCIASAYKLVMKGADIVGAFLVTKNNPEYEFFLHTPEGYAIGPGQVIKAVGNLYGAPPAGQNFSLEFDKCVRECGYSNTPWDLKLFYKWIDDSPLILMAHSDDFRWFGPHTMLHEWDLLVATFNAHKYEITDATDKEFVGINIYRDAQFNYYMDQTRMVDAILKEANMTGSRDEHLPYPMTGLSLSKQDNATEEEQPVCARYPYRRVVGQLMYGMVHTLVTIMYALNVLSRYSNNPGPRHILFLKHLLRYVKYSKKDRLIFRTHDGPKDIATMTSHLQLRFQCDADLGGNMDNKHSQTSYLGYLAGNLICWNSTDQGSISTSSCESEIKAVAHCLKADAIACRGILNTMGWIQDPTPIEEDNAACVFASNVEHMTRNLKHIELTDSWIKIKVKDKTCILVKIGTENNNADIGTKRVSQSLFNALTHKLVDKQLRNNL